MVVLFVGFILPAAAGPIPDVRLSPGDHPAREAFFVPDQDDAAKAEFDHSWYVRTGAKKGLSGQADTDQERFVAPDVAILGRGFSAPLQAIMSSLQEPFIQVTPGNVASISNTKPLLIIPSGALSGTETSSFFKTVLSEYAGSGGIIFCLAQKQGSDFSALPVPEGERVQAAGWSEDTGPLFRTSRLTGPHPLFANISGPVPAIETDGYFIAYPARSHVLMSRPDGFPTMVLYPSGKGWVLVTALFTDFSGLLGAPESDEMIFLRNLIAWSKNPGEPELIKTGAAATEQKKVQAGAAPAAPAARQGMMPSAFSVRPALERKGDLLKLSLQLPAQPGFENQTVVVRTGGQEKSVTLSKDTTALSFDMPLAGKQQRLSYAVYNTNGRSLARGSVLVPDDRQAAVSDAYYLPGKAAAVNFPGLGKGEVTLLGIGFLDNMILSDSGSMKLSVPRDLPAGTYRMQWTLEEIQGDKKQGEFSIDLCGYQVSLGNVVFERKQEGQHIEATATFAITASQKTSGQLSVILKAPSGKRMSVAQPVLSLAQGLQSVPVSFSFTPDTSGMWELIYTLSTTLPEGAGIPDKPVVLASGSSLFDVGDKAVLAVVPEKALYYEPSGPVNITAIIAGTGATSIEATVDDKRIFREKIQLSGLSRYRFSTAQLAAGTHSIGASLTDGHLTSSQEVDVVYGLSLPDLDASIRTGEPKGSAGGPVMPITVTVRNRGKSPAGPNRAGIYEGIPPKSGKRLAVIDVPELAPGRQHTTVFDWPLYSSAGPHTLSAIADTEKTVTESNKKNNGARTEINIPDLLLIPGFEQSAFTVDTPVSLPVSVFNLTTRSFKALNLEAGIDDGTGRKIASDNMVIDQLPANSEKKFTPGFNLVSKPVATYTFSARLGREQQAITREFKTLPTLLLAGSFDGTPSTAVQCKPFTVRYKIKNSGNIAPTSGSVRLEIMPSLPGRPPVYSKQFPVVIGESSAPVNLADVGVGLFKANLTATAANASFAVNREFSLADQTISVSGPLDVRRINQAFPRVLVWLDRGGPLVKRAISENIVKQAFGQEDLYYKIVQSEDDFISQAKTGIFDTYVLFELEEMPAKMDWLKDSVSSGRGIVLAGSTEASRAVAENFGFTLEEAYAKKGSDMLTFGTGLDLSGNLPISGKILYPQKKGAKEAAVYSGTKQAAALLDGSNKGKIIVMPISLSESALQGGASGLYSLVLRKAAISVSSPGDQSVAAFGLGELSISAPGGPMNARIVEVLPPGSRIIWTNADGKADKNRITYSLKTETEPRKLLYLFQRSLTEKTLPVTEIYYECDGKFVSQGKIE